MSRRKLITCCPHCGSTEGIVTKTTLINVPWCVGFDGTPGYNGEMYDNAESITQTWRRSARPRKPRLTSCASSSRSMPAK